MGQARWILAAILWVGCAVPLTTGQIATRSVVAANEMIASAYETVTPLCATGLMKLDDCLATRKALDSATIAVGAAEGAVAVGNLAAANQYLAAIHQVLATVATTIDAVRGK